MTTPVQLEAEGGEAANVGAGVGAGTGTGTAAGQLGGWRKIAARPVLAGVIGIALLLAIGALLPKWLLFLKTYFAICICFGF